MTLRNVFAANLRHFRRERGMSQEVLAHEAKVSRGYMSDLEMGKYSVSLDKIEAIAKTLQVEPHRLLEPIPRRPTGAKR